MLDILLVDDEPDILSSLAQVLSEEGHGVQTAPDGHAAIKLLAVRAPHLIITDVRLPVMDGMTLLRRVRLEFPHVEVLIMTGFASIGDAVEAMKDDAVDYLVKPFELDRLLALVRRIDERRRLRQTRAPAPPQQPGGRVRPSRLVGACEALQRARAQIEALAATKRPVLVVGDRGTGKEHAARSLHAHSGRRDGPFVSVDCEAPSSFLLARLVTANEGTLFLDEIATVPLEVQAKLVGIVAGETAGPDVRLVAASRALAPERASRLLPALSAALAHSVVELPPLRERACDIPLLVEHFLREFRARDLPGSSLSPAAWSALQKYAFPGNVRELRRAIQHAAILAGSREIDVAHLPDEITGAARACAVAGAL
ncbi:MAG TPA: response regulator [Polyangia bacterium]|jgi:DNA-binding NtrC family response regulator|nr:response regulator [Polyangia bacterium]